MPRSSSADRRPLSEGFAPARRWCPRPPGSPRSTRRISPPTRIRTRPPARGGRPRRPGPPPTSAGASDAYDDDVVAGQPGRHLGPSVRIPFFPGPEGRGRDDHPRETVASDAFHQTGEIRGRAELSQQGCRITTRSRRLSRQSRSGRRHNRRAEGNRRATRAMPPGHWNYSHARERGTGIPVRPSRPGRELSATLAESCRHLQRAATIARALALPAARHYKEDQPRRSVDE